MKTACAIVLTACGRLNIESLDDAHTPEPMCAGIHTFCDSFDRETPIEASWTAMNSTGGALSFASDAPVSPPNVLVVDVAFPIAGSVELVKELPAPSTAVHVAYDLDLEVTTLDNAEVDLVQLVWAPPPAPCTELGYHLVRYTTNMVVLQETYAGCGGIRHRPIAFPASGTGFHHVELDITPGAIGVARVRLRVDSATVYDETASIALPARPLTLLVGAPDVRDTTGPWRIRYDNLVVDVE